MRQGGALGAAPAATQGGLHRAVCGRPNPSPDPHPLPTPSMQGIKFYDPEIAEDTPESVELGGMRHLLAAVGGNLGGGGGRVLFAPDGSGAVGAWGSLDDVVMGGVSQSGFGVQQGERERRVAGRRQPCMRGLAAAGPSDRCRLVLCTLHPVRRRRRRGRRAGGCVLRQRHLGQQRRLCVGPLPQHGAAAGPVWCVGQEWGRGAAVRRAWAAWRQPLPRCRPHTLPRCRPLLAQGLRAWSCASRATGCGTS